MQFQPRIRNFKIKKLQRIDAGSTPQISQNPTSKIQTISHIIEAVLDKMGGEDLFRSEHPNKRKSYTSDKIKEQDIIISNKEFGKNFHYDEQFIERMDPRDKIINVTFHIVIPYVHLENYHTENIFSSNLFKAVSKKIQEYLVNMLEIVVSVSFNQLMDGKLKENQCKDYASKNILLNVHQICKATFKTLKERMIIQGVEQQVSLAITQLVDHTLTNSVKCLAPYYPQAPPTGKTPRIRQHLLAVDRNYNSELDFLSTQGLTLQKNSSGDYTEYIMRVINQAILAISQTEDQDQSQLTLFQKFKDFIENLIWIAKEDCYAKVMNKMIDQNKKKTSIIKQTIVSQQESSAEEPTKEHSLKKKQINKFFRKSTISNAIQAFKIQGEKPPFITEQARDKQIAIMRRNHEVEVGQKLPSSIETFSKNDIKDHNFSAKHSSVLRVITKWAQNLESIFQNAQKFVLNRNYPFTTLSGKSLYPTSQLKQSIYKQLKQMREKKNKIHAQLVAKNKIFQSHFLSNNVGDFENLSRFIKRYTQTRVVASKMNTLIIKFMQQYVSQLINLLVEAGKQPGQQYVNLVSFRIGDLMRARMHVNEAAFIRILRTLYLLDQSQSKEQPFFKLVRVKNKLDEKDNNVLINFLFKGKIQCQLQISCQKIEGKQQKYYAFSHFLYELSRGSFGILSECAIIISQHDPIASSSSYFEAKKFMPSQKHIMTEKVKEILQGKHSIFLCIKCNRLVTNDNNNTFQKKKGIQNICNSCFIKFFNKGDFKSLQIEASEEELTIESFLSNPQLLAWMSQLKDSSHTAKISHFGQFQEYKKITLIYSVNQRYNQIDFHLLVYDQTDFQWNMVNLNQSILFSQEIKQQDFDIKNITTKVKQKVPFKELTYIQLTLNRINMADLIKANKKIPPEINLVNKLYQIEQTAKSFIAKGDIEDILKNKNQTLAFNKNMIKMDMMEEMSKNASNINHIQYIFAQELQLEKIPDWVSKTDKVKLLNLNKNQIKNATIIENKQYLKQLYIKSNQLQEINCSKMVKLQKLDCQDNLLNEFICLQLPHLVELNLATNRIRQIDLSKFPIVQDLNLSNNNLLTLNTDKISPRIQKLNLQSNQLTQQFFKYLPQSLKELKVNYNKITAVGGIVFIPHRLSILQISNNQLKYLYVQKLPFLTKLQASNNDKIQGIYLNNVPLLTHFTLDNCKIKVMKNINFPRTIKWISLCNNQLQQFYLYEMLNIENLNLTGNKLTKLQLKGCRIEILTLYQNSLQSLDKFVFPNTLLRLFLKDNNLTSITLNNFPSLQILNLQSNKLKEINIDNMPCLKELALDYNCLNSIDSIKIPYKLQRLFIRKNQLDKLNLSDLPQLTICVLDQNPLTKVSLRNMPKLGEVGLMRTSIQSSQDIDLPNTVTKIFMHYNLLKQITYRNMPNLFLIVHQGNKLTQATLQNLPELHQIYLNQNQIDRLVMSRLSKLQKIVLPNNNLSDIVLKDMPFLKEIILTNNKLTQLDLDSVSLVQKVTVDSNLLTQINWKDLTALNFLNVSANCLKKVRLQNLPLLITLNLTSNQISQISLIRLKSLKQLQLQYNPIEILELVELKRLQTLSLYKSLFTQWQFDCLPKLKNLTLYYSQIKQLILLKTPFLQKLQLSYCSNLHNVNFNDLHSIKSITCTQCSLQPIRIQGLKQLEQINVYKSCLKSAEFIDLPKVKYITAFDNELSSINLVGLPKLQSLSLDINKLTYINLQQCKATTNFILGLAQNPLKQLKLVDTISTLSLNNTDLTTIQLIDLTNLIKVQICDNSLLQSIKIQGCIHLGQIIFNNIEFTNLTVISNIDLYQTHFKFIKMVAIYQWCIINAASAEMQELIRTQNPTLSVKIKNPTKEDQDV